MTDKTLAEKRALAKHHQTALLEAQNDITVIRTKLKHTTALHTKAVLNLQLHKARQRMSSKLSNCIDAIGWQIV